MDDELRDEEKRIRRLKFIVNFALNFIRLHDISHEEALSIFEGVKKHALKLFPDKEEAFDIIYAPRFRRLLNEKYKRS
ncbi:MAG: hypothetical protein N2513_06095 [Deltaproteobacteria bacterium]|nr:hypothetical protein [Deltaproteobacteria bacterium]